MIPFYSISEQASKLRVPSPVPTCFRKHRSPASKLYFCRVPTSLSMEHPPKHIYTLLILFYVYSFVCLCVSMSMFLCVYMCLCVSMLLCGGSYRDRNRTSEFLEMESQEAADCPVWVLGTELQFSARAARALTIKPPCYPLSFFTCSLHGKLSYQFG